MTDYVEDTEFRINTTTTGHQIETSVASLADGGYVATWVSYDDTYGERTVYAQRYAADGTPAGDEVVVDVGDERTVPQVAGLADGGYVVVCQGADGGLADDIWIRRYAADGTPTGEKARVNSSVDGFQQDPAIAALADGGYVVTWMSNDSDAEGSVYGEAVWSQRYAADGTPVGGETLVNSTTTGSQLNASVTGLADGGYVVVWESDATDNARDIYAQRYAADSSPVGGETLVNSVTTGFQFAPSVAGLADGGYVITWTTGNYERDPYLDVVVRRFDSDGAPVGYVNETPVNTTSSGYQGASQVTALAEGGYVVTWTDDSSNDGNGSGIFAQRYHADGTPDGGEILVNSTTDGSQTTQAAAAFGSGYVVVWQMGTFQTSDADIYAKTWSADTPPPNAAPVANNDSFTTNQGATLTITAPGLLVNDTDADGDALTAIAVSSPAHGFLTANPDGSFTYAPQAGFSGVDSFTYQATDGTSDSAPATVTITVANSAPVAADDSYTARPGMRLDVAADAGLLANDTDADDDALTAVLISGPEHGALTLNPDGSFTYTPEAGYSGADSFTYKANDGVADSGSATATITIAPPSLDLIEGSGWSDFLLGTAGADDIRGGGGWDIIFGGRGNDRLAGNAGNDFVFGGEGSDTIAFLPGDGHDLVFGFDVGPGASDRIALDARAFASYGDLTSSGALSNGWLGAQVTYDDGSQLTLLGVNAQILTADHFAFV